MTARSAAHWDEPDVVIVGGHDSRPPQPLGYQLPSFDPALLDQQRVRLPFWRRTAPD